MSDAEHVQIECKSVVVAATVEAVHLKAPARGTTWCVTESYIRFLHLDKWEVTTTLIPEATAVHTTEVRRIVDETLLRDALKVAELARRMLDEEVKSQVGICKVSGTLRNEAWRDELARKLEFVTQVETDIRSAITW